MDWMLSVEIRGVKKDFKIFAAINWNDRENYGSNEFCSINQELPAEHADFVTSTTDWQGKMMGTESLEEKIRATVLDILNVRYLLAIDVAKGASEGFGVWNW